MKFIDTIHTAPTFGRRLTLSDFYLTRLLGVLSILACVLYLAQLAFEVKKPLVISKSFLNIPEQNFQAAPVVSYRFEEISHSFKRLPLIRIHEVEKTKFERMILESIKNPFLRKRAKHYIKDTLEMAEKYQVDPFWAVSIMWTESHFNFKAKSRANAHGLMQVLPGTAEFVSRTLQRKYKREPIHKNFVKPIHNIELGVYYLKYLHDKFKGNYRLATVAYNMGPFGVINRLKRNLPVGVRNNYLDKVRRHYKLLTKNYQKLVLSTPRPYKSTYAYKNISKSYHYSDIKFFNSLNLGIKFAMTNQVKLVSANL